MRQRHSVQQRRPQPSFFSWNNGWGKVIALSLLLIVLCVILGILVVMSYKIVSNPHRQKSPLLRAIMSRRRVRASE